MMTMEELLNQLIKKAKLESEEAHRQYVAASNGLAALHLVKLVLVFTESLRAYVFMPGIEASVIIFCGQKYSERETLLKCYKQNIILWDINI